MRPDDVQDTAAFMAAIRQVCDTHGLFFVHAYDSIYLVDHNDLAVGTCDLEAFTVA